jgi:hypothetical protein
VVVAPVQSARRAREGRAVQRLNGMASFESVKP